MKWLLQVPQARKHHANFAHPLATFFMHYSCVAISTVLVHDWMVDLYKTSYLSDDDGSCLPFPLHRRNVGQFLALYFICYQSWRLALVRNEPPAALYCEFYRQTFLCSVTIFNAAVGLYSNRPIIATSFCVAVGIDQLLWYVDLIVYFTCGKFPIGVTKYLFWPGTSFASRITSTHHLWTIPLVLWASGGMHFLSLPLSAFVVVSNVLLSRFMTPRSIILKNNHDKNEEKYLNINMAHELWRDIKIKYLLVFEDRLPYLFRLFVVWLSFNSIVFGLLYIASERILGEAPLC